VQGRAPPSYYALSLGGWTLLSLNSEEPHGPGSAQLRWLDHRLRRGRGTCRLAFWHRPRYSAGTTHGDQPDVEPLWNTLRGRATLVLNGHEHASQRFRTIEGLTEIVAGAGSGAEPLYPLRATAGSPSATTATSRRCGSSSSRAARGSPSYPWTDARSTRTSFDARVERLPARAGLTPRAAPPA
jgi:hypothetical protein